MSKIKKVKAFIAEGIPQFDVILRRQALKTVTISVIPTGVEFEGDFTMPEDHTKAFTLPENVTYSEDKELTDDEKEDKKHDGIFTKIISPPESGEGIIQIVKRINDDKLFHQGDDVRTKEGSAGTIISFHEDRVHCEIIFLFEQEKDCLRMSEINDLDQRLYSFGDESSYDSLGEEKYEVEDDEHE